MERTWKADYEKFARTARENVAATLDNMDYPALERAAELILAAKAAGKRLHISGIGKPAHLAGYGGLAVLLHRHARLFPAMAPRPCIRLLRPARAGESSSSSPTAARPPR